MYYHTYPINDLTLLNSIPRNFNIKIYVHENIFAENIRIKWPIHVADYECTTWSNIYEIFDEYTHPIYGDITVLINKELYEPYSHAKSARN